MRNAGEDRALFQETEECFYHRAWYFQRILMFSPLDSARGYSFVTAWHSSHSVTVARRRKNRNTAKNSRYARNNGKRVTVSTSILDFDKSAEWHRKPTSHASNAFTNIKRWLPANTFISNTFYVKVYFTVILTTITMSHLLSEASLVC